MPSVSGVSPNPVPGSNSAQQLTIIGSNFVSGATVTYHDPQGNSYPGHSTTFVNSGQLTDAQFNDAGGPRRKFCQRSHLVLPVGSVMMVVFRIGSDVVHTVPERADRVSAPTGGY